ncbi:MAG: DUF6916 family protein [Roseateles sp.]
MNINKRDFLKGGAATLVAGAGSTSALAAVPPSLDALSSLAGWQARLGQCFDVDGHPLTLSAITPVPGQAASQQFSLSFSFAGELPARLGDAMHRLTSAQGPAQTLYLARTSQGLRADFCRLIG